MHVDISVVIVWIKMLAGDSGVTAEKSAGSFRDPQVRQFYDPDRHCGKAIGNSVGWQGKIAWDIYLFYTPGSEWIKSPPTPVDWIHQLKETWADRDRLRTGRDLVEGLETAMSKLTG
jgi:hypothetical protein